MAHLLAIRKKLSLAGGKQLNLYSTNKCTMNMVLNMGGKRERKMLHRNHLNNNECKERKK